MPLVVKRNEIQSIDVYLQIRQLNWINTNALLKREDSNLHMTILFPLLKVLSLLKMNKTSICKMLDSMQTMPLHCYAILYNH